MWSWAGEKWRPRKRKLKSDIRLCLQDCRWEREGGEGRRRWGVKRGREDRQMNGWERDDRYIDNRGERKR